MKMFMPLNRIFRIILLYSLGTTMLGGHWYLARSNALKPFLESIGEARADRAFGVIAAVGLLHYGLLVAGVGIITILTALLIMKRKDAC